MAQTADDGIERDAWVRSWAERCAALGLSPIALALFEGVRAFGFLADQALLIIHPLTAGILNDTTLERTSALLRDAELMDRMQSYLEERERER